MKFKHLLSEAQFHGAKRIAESNYKCYWLISLMILLSCASTVVYVTINRFFSDPTYIVEFETVRYTIPFPTVIICPEVSFPDNKMDEFVNEMFSDMSSCLFTCPIRPCYFQQFMTEDKQPKGFISLNYPPTLNATYIRSVLKQFAAFLSPDVVFNYEDLEKIQELLDYNNLDVETVGLRLTSSCADILLRCKWHGSIVNCSSLFQIEITRYGFCCIFNGRSLKREMREHGSNSNTNKGVYVNNLGFMNSLMVAVDQREDLFDINLVYKWVTLRTGQHYVDISSANGSAISPGQEIWFTYDTHTMQVSDDAASLSSDLRKCHLANFPLKYFPTYHKSYCFLECEMQRTIEKCECLQVSHPSLPDVPVCRASRLQCARSATVSYAIDECNCPPACNIETDNSIYDTYDLKPDSPTIDNFYEGLNLKQVTVLRVFVSKRNKKISQRRSYFTTFNLFAQLGGVFNVFFGCSILTLLELVMLAISAIRH